MLITKQTNSHKTFYMSIFSLHYF